MTQGRQCVQFVAYSRPGRGRGPFHGRFRTCVKVRRSCSRRPGWYRGACCIRGIPGGESGGKRTVVPGSNSRGKISVREMPVSKPVGLNELVRLLSVQDCWESLFPGVQCAAQNLVQSDRGRNSQRRMAWIFWVGGRNPERHGIFVVENKIRVLCSARRVLF